MSDTSKKVLFGIFACVVLLVLFYWAASFIFMQIYGLPVGMSRPWTIIQYWAMYRESGYKWLRLAVNFASFSLAPACRTCRSDCFDKRQKERCTGQPVLQLWLKLKSRIN